MAPRSALAGYLAVLAADGQPAGPGSAPSAELKSGQFHDVVLAGDVAYRFPRDAESCRLLPGRARLLTALADCELPAEIPVPLGTSWLSRPAGSCYLATRRLAGIHPHPGLLGEPRFAEAMTVQLAGLLDALARAGTEPAIRQSVPAAQPGDWRDWAGRVREVLFPLMSPAGRRRAEAEVRAVATVAPDGDTLVHTDLGGANLLLDTGADVPRIAGILDWDNACIGNQASDLASLAVTFGWPLAARIEQRRKGDRHAGPLLPAARLIAATFALQQALPAALSGDEASLDDGLSRYVR